MLFNFVKTLIQLKGILIFYLKPLFAALARAKGKKPFLKKKGNFTLKKNIKKRNYTQTVRGNIFTMVFFSFFFSEGSFFRGVRFGDHTLKKK